MANKKEIRLAALYWAVGKNAEENLSVLESGSLEDLQNVSTSLDKHREDNETCRVASNIIKRVVKGMTS